MKVFGPGRAELLELIAEEGSISKAAKRMGMSYKGLGYGRRDEYHGTKTFAELAERRRKRKGAELTETGKKIVQRYNSLSTKLDAIVEKEREILKLI